MSELQLVFLVISTVNAGMELNERLTTAAAPVVVAPVTHAPRRRPATMQPKRTVAMVSVPSLPSHRRWFERSLAAPDWPREKGRPEPLPMDQFRELMVDLAISHSCESAARPRTCSFAMRPGTFDKVYLDVTYEEEA